MTRNSGFKKLVRKRAERTGASYSTARAHLQRRSELADVELVTRCAAPIVRRMHSPDPIARAAVVPGLTRDQGSLLAFWILFAHIADGVTGLCRAHPHRLVDPDFWTLMETGLRDDAALLAILAQLRMAVDAALEQAPGSGDNDWLEFLDAGAISRLDVEFARVMPRSLHRIADQIRAHPRNFQSDDVTAK